MWSSAAEASMFHGLTCYESRAAFLLRLLCYSAVIKGIPFSIFFVAIAVFVSFLSLKVSRPV